MRKIILMMSVSIDGFIEGPNRELDWHMVDDELHSHFNEQLSAMGAFMSGRVTYELMAGFWPTADTDPSSTRPMVEFARIWRDMPKIVFSRTLERADWNTTLVRDIVPEGIMELKAQPGGDLALGGADVAAAFIRHDLIDEYRLYVHPVVIGRGKPLFQASDAKINLQLAETRTFGNGVVLLRYQRPEAGGTEIGDAASRSLNRDAQGTVADRLMRLRVKGVLVQMAKNGQILELRCEMPTCYCPNGRDHFDPWPDPGYAPGHEWSPNADHYPTLKMDGGQLRPWNVRLAHVYCNNTDFGWRTRIRRMLEKDPTLSFDKIAEALNKKKHAHVPPEAASWTAEIVRKAYVS